MNKTLSKTFSLLRLPLAVLVVYLHIDSLPVPVSECMQMGEGAVYNLIKIMVVQIANLAVPCFYIISGYLLLHKRTDYKILLKKKARSLLLPYVLWNLIAALYIYATQRIDHFSFYGFFLSPANFPLWFLRDLIVLTLLSPVIRQIVEKMKYASLAIFTVLYMTGCFGLLSSSYENVSIFYFFLGAFAGIRKKMESVLSKKNFYRLLPAVASALYVLSVIYYQKNGYLDRLWLLAGSIAMITIVYRYADKINVDNKISSGRSSLSYFVYLSHKVGPTYLAKLPFHFMPQTYCVAILRFLLSPLLTVALCYAFYVLGRKVMPKFFSILVGDKS